MLDEFEIEALLSLDGARFEAAEGYVVEFMARRTEATKERPHGLSYAFVFRPLDGEPYVRFDNAHAVERRGGKYGKTPRAYDHWHRRAGDPGRLYVHNRGPTLGGLLERGETGDGGKENTQ